MVKIVNRKLTDINWRDIMTGELVTEKYEIEQEKNINKRIEKRIEMKIRESIEKNIVDWKIFVEWLGRVKI